MSVTRHTHSRLRAHKNAAENCQQALLLLPDVPSVPECALPTHNTATPALPRPEASREALLQSQCQLRGLAVELALDDEQRRRQLSDVIHEDAVQTLACCKMQLAMLEREALPESAVALVANMQEGLAEVIQRLRTLSFELSPAVLYRLGLASALSWLGDHVAAESGTSIKVVTEWEGEELHEELRIVVFQAVRELLSNAVKHAQAHQIEVRLRRSGGRATVEVSDDGQGFDPESLPPPSHLGGYGLFSLQQRLNHLGGRLQIISQIGHGARFLIEVPGSLPAHA